MKKIFLTSITTIALTVPAIADPVVPNISPNAESADCTQPVLGTTTGTSNLQASWTPNTLNIDWYNGETKLTSNTCTYGSGITVPATNPTKTGYTFAGWKVKSATAPTPAAQCSIPRAYLSEETSVFASKGLDQEYCEGSSGYDSENDDLAWFGVEEGGSCSDSEFAHLDWGEWSVTFSGGMVKGRALCSSTSGEWATAGTPDQTGGGRYCWCQPTEYIANGSSSCNLNVSSSSWVFHYAYGNADDCADSCAYHCVYYVQLRDDFRGALFGLAQ